MAAFEILLFLAILSHSANTVSTVNVTISSLEPSFTDVLPSTSIQQPPSSRSDSNKSSQHPQSVSYSVKSSVPNQQFGLTPTSTNIVLTTRQVDFERSTPDALSSTHALSAEDVTIHYSPTSMIENIQTQTIPQQSTVTDTAIHPSSVSTDQLTMRGTSGILVSTHHDQLWTSSHVTVNVIHESYSSEIVTEERTQLPIQETSTPVSQSALATSSVVSSLTFSRNPAATTPVIDETPFSISDITSSLHSNIQSNLDKITSTSILTTSVVSFSTSSTSSIPSYSVLFSSMNNSLSDSESDSLNSSSVISTNISPGMHGILDNSTELSITLLTSDIRFTSVQPILDVTSQISTSSKNQAVIFRSTTTYVDIYSIGLSTATALVDSLVTENGLSITVSVDSLVTESVQSTTELVGSLVTESVQSTTVLVDSLVTENVQSVTVSVDSLVTESVQSTTVSKSVSPILPSSTTIPELNSTDTDTVILYSSETAVESSSSSSSSSSFPSTETVSVTGTFKSNVVSDAMPMTATTVVDVSGMSSTPYSMYPETTTIAVESHGRVRFMIAFNGNCDILKSYDQLQLEFWKSLLAVISSITKTNVPTGDIELSSFECHPMRLVLTFANVVEDEFILSINSSISNSSFNVPIIDGNKMVIYDGIDIKIMSLPDEKSDGIESVRVGLEQVDIIIIVTAAFLFALLLSMGGLILCRECYKRKRSASFNLLDVPHVNLKLSDFTLTRIPRPQMIYHENSSMMPASTVSNGRTNHKTRQANGDSEKERVGNVEVNAENIHVRMRQHDDGLVVGITCSAPTSQNDDSSSDTSSPKGVSTSQSKQHLLKGNNSTGSTVGMENPNFSHDEELSEQTKVLIQEDENEQLL